jgi:hypothetical protein
MNWSSSLFIFQAAVYGIGVCAEFGGAKFKTIVGGDAKCTIPMYL